MPIYLQLMDNSATEASLRFLPLSVGTAIGALGAGLSMRATGEYLILNKGTLISMIVGSASMSFLR